MLKKLLMIGIIMSCLHADLIFAQDDNGLGQTIQIYTHFNRIVGRPTWLLVIRDIDRGINEPYLFDILQPDNFFLIFTHSRHYSIVASRMQFTPYQRFPYSQCRVPNFCNLESNGRIIRGESMTISVRGDLTPNRDTYVCDRSRYPENNFTIVNLNSFVASSTSTTVVTPAPTTVVTQEPAATTVVTSETAPTVVASPAPVLTSSETTIVSPARSVVSSPGIIPPPPAVGVSTTSTTFNR